MALINVQGELLTSDCNVILNQTNCFSRMQSGMSFQIARLWPEVHIVDKNLSLSPEERLGKFSFVAVDGRIFINLYGQYGYGRGDHQTNYEALENAIDGAFTMLKEMDQPFKIGLPYLMGCENADGDWLTISKILNRKSVEYGLDVYAYYV